MNTCSACSCGLAHWAKLLRLHVVEVVLQCSCVAWWIALTFSHIRWSPFSFLFSRVLSPYLLMEAHCRTRCTCGRSGLLLVLRPVGGEQCPPPIPPCLCSWVCWSRCQRIPALQQREQGLRPIPQPVDNSCQCYRGNVLCYSELMKLCFSGWDEA